MLITSCCGFSMFLMGVLYFVLLSVPSGWQQEQGPMLWHGCFCVVRDVGVRALCWFFKVQLSALEGFFCHFLFSFSSASCCKTSREYSKLPSPENHRTAFSIGRLKKGRWALPSSDQWFPEYRVQDSAWAVSKEGRISVPVFLLFLLCLPSVVHLNTVP